MKIVTRSIDWNETSELKIPQLDVARGDAGEGVEVTLELADLTAGQLSAVAALMQTLEAAEVRARSAERQLAEHLAHCICHAADLAAGTTPRAETLMAAA